MFKDIPNFEGLYQVNEFGVILSLKRHCNSKNNKLRIVPEKNIKIQNR